MLLQKPVAILFLILSFAIQYGKLISYLNCSVTNTSDTRAVQCDCEKILTDTNGDEDANLLARVQMNDKIEEWYNAKPLVSTTAFNLKLTINATPVLSSPSSGYIGSVFEPPRLS
jgi:hypothetical protein